nr:IS30 family transposase [Methylococcus capsulatus]
MLDLTMTYDNGKGMAHHQGLTQSTGIKVFFAHPYSPRERGINENTNGLLRRDLPKGMDLSVYPRNSLMPLPFSTTLNPASPWPGSPPPSYSYQRAH